MSNTATDIDKQYQPEELKRHRRNASLASLIGTSIEWYEYYIYGAAAALVFPHVFFPNVSPQLGLVYSFASYAVAFIVRPIGGAIFGHYGDRIGRKRTLVITLLITGLSTFAIGLLPSAATAGETGAVILVLLRVLQGIGVGGEWGGSALLSLEWGDQKKRGLSGAWPQLGTSVGLILSTAAILGGNAIAGDAFLEWGWRIPFLLSFILIIVGLVVRLKVEETPSFAKQKKSGAVVQNPVKQAIVKYPKEIVLSAFLRMSEQMPFYVFTAFTLDYATRKVGMDRQFVLLATIVAAVIDMFLLPYFSILSDKVGRRKMYYIGCAVLALMAYPYFMLLDTGKPALVFLAIALSMLPHSLQYGAQASLIAEQFPANIRYAGSGIGYQLASVVAGGPAPLVATALLAYFASGYAVASYLLFGAVVAAIALRLMPDRSNVEM
ncbi:MFS transporter [Chitinasiproducens palmae]|uniref:Sugar phosphate permease n=1 Tax=Chitinasiproducens palmae TaxID=1770053 RepID=A0A1H2PX00_9BURK|nr:MFS transporter [Chitinasiproducens palmae]SDV51502.1 Sugar phosphate permease [Chitinasiproducens palmae]